MPRLSVYVPDELFEQAKELEDSENTSRLVQRGLERLVAERQRVPGYAQAPAQSVKRIVELRERLLAEARADYERGYVIALEAADAMPLHVINALVDENFDLRKWLDPFKAGFHFEENQKPTIPLGDSEEVWRELKENIRAPSPGGAQFKGNEWWWLWKTADALGDLADPIGLDHYSFTPTAAQQRGYVDAMRELWSALEDPSGHPRPTATYEQEGGDARSPSTTNAGQ